MDEMTEFQKTSEKRVIMMGGGDTGLDPAAVGIIRKNAEKFVKSSEFEESLHYGPARGLERFLSSARRYYSRDLNTDLKEENILFLPGTQLFFLYFVNAYTGLILTTSPDYIGFDGAKISGKFVSLLKTPVNDGDQEFHYEIEPKQIKNAIQSNKLINRSIRSNPTNPTDEVQPKSLDKEIREASSVVLSAIDTTYRGMIYDDIEYGFYLSNNTLIIDSLSKRGFCGWRGGVAIGPENIIETFRKKQSAAILCPPNPQQFVLARMIDNGDIDRVTEIQRLYNKNQMDLASETFKSECNVEFARLARQASTYYSWLWVEGLTKKGLDSEKLQKGLMYEDGIVTCKGSDFFYGDPINYEDSRHPYETLRISVSKSPKEDLKHGMTGIAQRVNRIFHNTR